MAKPFIGPMHVNLNKHLANKGYGVWFQCSRKCRFCRFILLPVPVQATVIISVEKMCLGSDCPHIWVNSYEFQDSPRAALLYADYDGFGEFFIAKLHRTQIVQWIFNCVIPECVANMSLAVWYIIPYRIRWQSACSNKFFATISPDAKTVLLWITCL